MQDVINDACLILFVCDHD